VARWINVLEHYIAQASKGAGELSHLKSAEWITGMNPIRQKNSKGGRLLGYPLEAPYRHLLWTSSHDSLLRVWVMK